MSENYSFSWEEADEARSHNEPLFSEGFDEGYSLQPVTASYQKSEPLWLMGYAKGAYHVGSFDGDRIHGESFATPAKSGYVGNGFEDDYRNAFEPGSTAAEAYDAGFLAGRVKKLATVDAFNERVAQNRKAFMLKG